MLTSGFRKEDGEKRHQPLKTVGALVEFDFDTKITEAVRL